MEEKHFTISTHPIDETEKTQFGIFISHSSKDTGHITELEEQLKKHNLHNDLIAEKFISSGENFHKKIVECLHCYAGVIILTKNALESNWVGYECGYFDGLNMPVLVWDRDNVLSFNNINKNFLNVYLLQHLPSVRTAEEVAKWIEQISIYSNIFKNETDFLKKKAFDEIIKNKIETVIVDISSPELQNKKDLFDRCSLSTLVVNFGMFYSQQIQNGCCVCAGEKLKNEKCIYKSNPNRCALIHHPDEQEDKLPDCVILNHVIRNGKYFDAKDKYHNGSATDSAMLSFYVPVHKYYGTEFKFIIDAPNAQTHKEIFNLCLKLGFNPTISDTLNSLRIYLSLKSEEAEGLLQLQDGLYYNNFLCPHSTKRIRK